MYQLVNLAQKFSLFSEQWQPKVVAEMNDYQFKIVRIAGDFIGIGDHEQYFYPDYSHYQPDYQQRIETACRIMQEKGWQSIRMDELTIVSID